MISLKGDKGSHASKAMSKALGDPGGGGCADCDEGPSELARQLGLPSAMKKDDEPKMEFEAPTLIGKSNERKFEDESDSESDLEKDLEDDSILAKLREKRLQELKSQSKQKQEWSFQGHGHYTEIVQDEFLPLVTKSKYSAVHFYHNDFERCKIVDKHLSILSQRYLGTRFAKLNAAKTPFFVQKLQIKVLPTIVLFKNGVAIDRVVGFDELGGNDDFTTQTLARRIGQAKILQGNNQKEEEEEENGGNSEDEDKPRTSNDKKKKPVLSDNPIRAAKGLGSYDDD